MDNSSFLSCLIGFLLLIFTFSFFYFLINVYKFHENEEVVCIYFLPEYNATCEYCYNNYYGFMNCDICDTGYEYKQVRVTKQLTRSCE